MKTTKTRFLCATFALVGLTSSLLVSSEADAGNWSAVSLGTSPPLWYEYRASVNDSGVIVGSTLSGTSTQPVLSATGNGTLTLSKPAFARLGTDAPTVVQGAAMDISADGRAVGFRAAANAPQRQASYWHWNGSAATHHDLHSSTPEGYGISAAYGISGDGLYIAGYVREKISPDKLSFPGFWNVVGTAASPTFTWTDLTLPAGANYGIAYGVSDGNDRAGKRYACGGTGSSGGSVLTPGFLSATCWDLTTPGAPGVITISETRAGTDTGIATSTVNRVRTVNVGSANSPVWETFAVGYFVGTNGAVVGFVKNLTTGDFDVHTALNTAYDSILSDVTRQSFSQNNARANASDTIFHGPLLVGTGATGTARVQEDDGTDVVAPVSVRGIYQARIARASTAPAMSAQARANAAKTCNMETELSSPSGVSALETISGVSRNALHMVGATGGQLVRMSNSLSAATVRVYQRNARVYTGPGAAAFQSVIYHWAEVTGLTGARVAWSNVAGCETFSSGIACTSSLAGASTETSEPGARREDALATQWAYVQAASSSGGACNLTPVYAVADLVETNPENRDTQGASETWDDCYAQDPPAIRNARPAPGDNVDLKRDYYHCGACGRSCGDPSNSDYRCPRVTNGTCNSSQCRANSWNTAPRYNCTAHHVSNHSSCSTWAYYSDSGCAHTDQYQLDGYQQSEMCSNHRTQGYTTSSSWVTNPSPQWTETSERPTSIVWPTTFQTNAWSRDNNQHLYQNTAETRSWLMNRGITYLGQMNNHGTHGFVFDSPSQYRTFSIAMDKTVVGQEASDVLWLAFYYNDSHNRQDKIALEVEYDDTKMDLDVRLHFACAAGAKGTGGGKGSENDGVPRLDGIWHCGPNNASAYGTTCLGNMVSGQEHESHTLCRATKAVDGKIELEGYLDCWTSVRQRSDGRDGWAFIRIARKNKFGANEVNECSPITVRVGNWSDDRHPNDHAPVSCVSGPAP